MYVVINCVFFVFLPKNGRLLFVMFRAFNFMRMAMIVIMCFPYCFLYAERVDLIDALSVAKIL